MKKGKLIALALTAAITLTGAGYAAWQDKVTINSQVNTGNLDVQFCDDTVINEYNKAFVFPENGSYLNLKDAGTIRPNANGEAGKVLTVDVGNFYPSKDRTGEDCWGILDKNETPALGINAVIKNMGSMPARFNGVNITYTGSKEVYDNIKVERGVLVKLSQDRFYFYNPRSKKWVLMGDVDDSLRNWIYINPEQYYPVDDLTLEQYKNFLNESIGDYTLNKDEMITWVEHKQTYGQLTSNALIPWLRLYIDEHAGNTTQNKNCTIQMEFNWKQFNQ